MPFINERIPAADIAKYGIEKIDKAFIVGGTQDRSWTIDRDREIYLRLVAVGRDEAAGESTWTFYWSRELIRLDIKTASVSGSRGGPLHSHKKVTRMELPPGLLDRRDEILKDLREALVTYKDGGVYATATTYTLTLDI